LRRSDTPIVRSELITGNPKASVVKAFARLLWEGARTTLITHPRKPSSHKPTETRDTATYLTTLMVLITKVMMVTSRA
jgi:calcineurin-like phosphoesterase family protein